MPPARLVFLLATTVAIALSLRTALVGPPPIGLAASAAVAYLALLLAGVFRLELQVFVDAVVRGPVDARGVALTFDDGPDPVHTRAVLDVLDAHQVKATFFVIGRKAEAHPELVREILRRGHVVGVHGHDHDRLSSLRGERRVKADLARAVEVLTRITGQRPTLFRPPIGHTNPIIGRVADRLGLEIVGWSASGRDGLSGADPRAVATRIARSLADGVIVLLHDAAERGDHEPAGPRALPLVLDAIARKGLVVTPLEAWLAPPS